MKPWLTDPLYGGMSEEAARRSYEASLLRPPFDPSRIPREPESEEQIAHRKAEIEIMLSDYEAAIGAAAQWAAERRARVPKGFRALRRA